MEFINKIKSNYHKNYFDDCFKEKKYETIWSDMLKFKNSDPELFVNLIEYFSENHLVGLEHLDFFKTKIIWINSFDHHDSEMLKSFLCQLFKKHNRNFVQDNYTNLVSKTLSRYKTNFQFNEDLSFEQIVKFSNFFQNLILFVQNKDFLILNTQSAFFESENKNYFINPHSTALFFFISQHPYAIYQRLKNEGNNNQYALNELFNFDKKLFLNNLNETSVSYKLRDIRHNWNVYTSSWIDPNVLSSYRGKIIDNNTINLNLEEQLVEVLFHMKGAGLDIKIDYDFITEFLQNNAFSNNVDLKLSNKEKKLINSNLDPMILERLHYKT